MLKRKLLSTAFVLFSITCCAEDKNQGKSQASEADLKVYESYKEKGFIDKGGYLYKITEETNGVKAKSGDMVWVHYTGKLLDGAVFDSSEGKNPISFQLGTGRVIKGWDEGIANLKEGEKATLVILPDYAYGSNSPGGIPPNSILVFDVKLMEVK